MKKKIILGMIVALACVVSGYSEVSRSIVDFRDMWLNVSLDIQSDVKELYIKEALPEDLSIINSEISAEYDVFSFNENENRWVISDSVDNINAKIHYQAYIENSGDEIYGTFSEDGVIEQDIIGDARACTDLICMQKLVLSNSPIKIVFNPGGQGIHKYAWIFRENSIYKSRIRLCESTRCNARIETELSLPVEWARGNYSLRFYDYDESEWKSFDFLFLVGEEDLGSYILIDPFPKINGDNLLFDVFPGKEGIKNKIGIYDGSENLLDQIEMSCPTGKCLDHARLSYTPAVITGTGTYYVGYYDYSESDISQRNKKMPFYVD